MFLHSSLRPHTCTIPTESGWPISTQLGPIPNIPDLSFPLCIRSLLTEEGIGCKAKSGVVPNSQQQHRSPLHHASVFASGILSPLTCGEPIMICRLQYLSLCYFSRDAFEMKSINDCGSDGSAPRFEV